MWYVIGENDKLCKLMWRPAEKRHRLKWHAKIMKAALASAAAA